MHVLRIVLLAFALCIALYASTTQRMPYLSQGASNEVAPAVVLEQDNSPSVINSTARQNLAVLARQRPTPAFAENCSQQLQFVATSFESVVQAKDFKAQFQQDERFADFPICVNPVIWLRSEQLKCEAENGRKRCDLSSLAKQQFAPNYTHLVLFLDSGKAYVQDGVMHLDKQDVYSVFIHELAHFSGFVDEYAVPAELAQAYCYEGSLARAPNLVIANEQELMLNQDYQLWQTYIAQLNERALQQKRNNNVNVTQISLSVSPSSTCDMQDISSFKPSDRFTFMQYHDVRVIPPIYKYMWKQQLKQYHHDIDVSRWFEKSALQHGELKAANYWANL